MHDSLIRELIGRYHGYEINTGACCQSQRGMLARCWSHTMLRGVHRACLRKPAGATRTELGHVSHAAEGDAFHVAFKDVQAAVLFCMEVQYQASGQQGHRTFMQLRAHCRPKGVQLAESLAAYRLLQRSDRGRALGPPACRHCLSSRLIPLPPGR